MTSAQIQLPDELLERAKQISAETNLSLDEIARRGVELFLSSFPEKRAPSKPWRLPTFDGGGILVPLEDLHDIAADEEAMRSLPR